MKIVIYAAYLRGFAALLQPKEESNEREMYAL
jgi:hypothetical protein